MDWRYIDNSYVPWWTTRTQFERRAAAEEAESHLIQTLAY